MDLFVICAKYETLKWFQKLSISKFALLVDVGTKNSTTFFYINFKAKLFRWFPDSSHIQYHSKIATPSLYQAWNNKEGMFIDNFWRQWWQPTFDACLDASEGLNRRPSALITRPIIYTSNSSEKCAPVNEMSGKQKIWSGWSEPILYPTKRY